LEVFDKNPHGETSHEIECTVVIHDIANPLAAGVDITAMSKTYSYDIDGPGHIAPHYFQDVQYLLKHARFIGEREVYETVTIFNYPQVRDLAIQMRADAVQILKDQFERLYLPSQLGRSLRNEQRLLSQYTKKEV
jgi:glutamyl-tRNA reductase